MILKSGASVRGLTAAASLWVTATVGSAVGIGMPFMAVIVTAIVLTTLVGLRPLGGMARRYGASNKEIAVDGDDSDDLVRVLRALQDRPVEVRNVRVDPDSDGPAIRLGIRVPPDLRRAGRAQSGNSSSTSSASSSSAKASS